MEFACDECGTWLFGVRVGVEHACSKCGHKYLVSPKKETKVSTCLRCGVEVSAVAEPSGSAALCYNCANARGIGVPREPDNFDEYRAVLKRTRGQGYLTLATHIYEQHRKDRRLGADDPHTERLRIYSALCAVAASVTTMMSKPPVKRWAVKCSAAPSFVAIKPLWESEEEARAAIASLPESWGAEVIPVEVGDDDDAATS